MSRTALPALLALLTSCAPAAGAAAPGGELPGEAQRLVGTWRLLSYVREEVPAGARSDVMGSHPSGYLNYSADGRLIVIVVGSDRHKPAGALASPQEAQALLTSMLAYAGTYTLDVASHTVTHHIEVSWDETRSGESHVRTYRLDGKRLILTTPPSRDPASGRTTVRTVTWEKLD